MALIAEEVVEEWLNQRGYFTIRGIKLGVDKMDILAVRLKDGEPDLRHCEVQASVNPISYISGDRSAKRRSHEKLPADVRAWVETKFRQPKKETFRVE